MAFIEVEKSVRDKDWHMRDLHSHPHYEIYYLQKGERSFFLSGALYNISAPALIVIPPHTMHKTEGGAFARFNVNVSTEYLNAFEKETVRTKSFLVIKPAETDAAHMETLLEQMSCVYKRNQKFADERLHALFSYFILFINTLDEKNTLKANAEQANVPPLLLKIIDYLYREYAQKHTLESLSARFFLSKAALLYNFKRYMNCSPIDFLLNVRLTKAKEFLVNTKKSVGEIAEQCGFSSANYFGLIFKQKENLSPANYRKHQRLKG